jgi:diguanylate cyclase (GGDEF)-like protein/PAS domain S-box-containing protein
MVNLKPELHILIVGAGRGGSALLELFLKEPLVKIAGIVDDNIDAIGLKVARDHTIPVYHDLVQALDKCRPNIVFNLTHSESVTEVVAKRIGPSSVIGGQEAELFWTIITRLQKTQDDLRGSQARLHAVIHNVREGIISINSKGIIENANPAIEAVFGYKPEELLGLNISLLMPEPYRSEHDFYLANYLKTGKGSVIGRYREVMGLHKQGHEFPVELSVAEMELHDTKYFVGIIRDITERKAAEEKMTRMALFDPLTGLPNRTMFSERLTLVLTQARRTKSLAAVLFIDLDGFKSVNDTLGHDAGDALLKEVGNRLTSCLRESDTAVRMGGDEFVVILTNLDVAKDAAMITANLIEKLNQPVNLKEQSCTIGASIGIAMFPDDGNDTGALVKKADEAMYRAKSNGKNQFWPTELSG